MNLLETLDQLLQSWRDVFPQERTFLRARRLLFGLLVSVRMQSDLERDLRHRKAVRGLVGRLPGVLAQPVARSQWDPHRLFDPVFDHLPGLLDSPEAPVLMALDDTLCRKSSPRIPGTSMVSPPFHVNFCYGQRFVQASILVTSTQQAGPARALPVRFEFAPPASKPRQPKKQPAKTSASQDPAQGNPTDTSPVAAPNPLTAEDSEKQKQFSLSSRAGAGPKRTRLPSRVQTLVDAGARNV